MNNKTCESCLYKVMTLDLSTPKKNSFKCANKLSDRYESNVTIGDGCDRWRSKKLQFYRW